MYQNKHNQNINIALHLIFIIIVLAVAVTFAVKNQEEVMQEETIFEQQQILTASRGSVSIKENPVEQLQATENPQKLEVVEESQSTWGKGIYDQWTEEEKYELAKIIFCEAGNQSLDTKMLVLCVVNNRVLSSSFPDSVHEVIFENSNGVYQFSPIANGSWDSNEPDEESYKVLGLFCDLEEDISNGATYFEAYKTDEEAENSWHGRNLQLLFKSDDVRFYKEYE